MRIGEATIYRVIEQYSLFDGMQFFPSLTPERLAENAHWLQPYYFDDKGRLVLCIQSYVVRTPSHVIVIDTCVGNHKPRPARLGDPASWNMMRGTRLGGRIGLDGSSG